MSKVVRFGGLSPLLAWWEYIGLLGPPGEWLLSPRPVLLGFSHRIVQLLWWVVRVGRRPWPLEVGEYGPSVCAVRERLTRPCLYVLVLTPRADSDCVSISFVVVLEAGGGVQVVSLPLEEPCVQLASAPSSE